MRLSILIIACAFLGPAGLQAQWVMSGPPVGGGVVALAADSQYVYIGTTQGHVWRRLRAEFTTGMAVEASGGQRPSEVAFSSFPNPCNASAVFTVSLPRPAAARLLLYDILGRCVRTVLDRRLEAGSYRFPVEMGSLATGSYVAVLSVDDLRLTGRLLVIR